MVFTNNSLICGKCKNQLLQMLNDKTVIIKDDFITISNLCYHSDHY